MEDELINRVKFFDNKVNECQEKILNVLIWVNLVQEKHQR